MAGMARAFPHVSDLHDYAHAQIMYMHSMTRAYVVLAIQPA
jgi:hypothetical protein